MKQSGEKCREHMVALRELKDASFCLPIASTICFFDFADIGCGNLWKLRSLFCSFVVLQPTTQQQSQKTIMISRNPTKFILGSASPEVK